MIKAFDLQQGNLPLLVSMPHPGTLLTPEVAQGLTPRAKRLEDTDWHTEKGQQAQQLLERLINTALQWGRDQYGEPGM